MSKSGQEIGAEHAATLEQYLDALWSRQEPLPRRAGQPNLTRIAASCGFDRGVFYTNPAAGACIAEYAEKDRIRFYDKVQKAEPIREPDDASKEVNLAAARRIVELEAVVLSQAKEIARLKLLERLVLSEGFVPP